MKVKTTESKKNERMLKLLAVIFAVMLWFYVDAEQNPVKSMHFDIPVQYVNQQENYEVSNGVTTVRVTVRGKEDELSGLRKEDFSAIVDLSNAQVGTGEYEIQLKAPEMAERISYLPNRTSLQLDQKINKQVPVRVRTSGTMLEGYEISSTEVLPNKVTISGLSQVLDEISDIETEAIDVSGITNEITKEVWLHVPEGVAIEGEKRIVVHFMIQEKQGRVNHEMTVAAHNVPSNMEVEVVQSAVTVQLSGNETLLKNQQELANIVLYVDCSGLDGGTHTLPVQVECYGALHVEQVAPAQVDVILTEKTNEQDTIPTEEIDEKNERESN